jgi:hypothetical protein
MVDADDILSWAAVDTVLAPILQDPSAAAVRLGICELVGDLVTTAEGRELVHDPNHLYWRTSVAEVRFVAEEETQHERIVLTTRSGDPIRPARSGQALFHAVTAKPGDRLLRRVFFRDWLKAERAMPLDEMSISLAPDRFPQPWPDGLMPSEYLLFNDPYRPRLKPLASWRQRLPPPVVAHQEGSPRFAMDLVARRRTDAAGPSDLERRVYERLVELGRSAAAGEPGIADRADRSREES